ncbi:MAG: trypsin-like peptidase domain-containing protein [Saprospiraceae bacterium]|nr:trypsin-like peptidase domain-containing protein [Saprospiraceae bacterium]
MANKFWSTLLAGALGGAATFGALYWLVQSPANPSDISATTTTLARQVSYQGAPPPFDFTKAADNSMSAVVHIKATESRQSALQRQRANPWSLFFGENFAQPRSGTGSGVIYTDDGYIMTNNHVVDFADEFLVTLHDNREFKARLVGRDADTDMAVIKIDAKNLPAIRIGNSDDVRVGEWVLAVGNPFDLTSTVTAGIVSAKSRDINIIQGTTGIESFIQTDAAVNPGNSGGALVNLNGELIGINSAIASPTGAFAGYAFAIPVNLARRIADDLIKYGEYRRAYLGVDIASMDTNVAQQLELDYTQGVAVVRLDPEGSAANAGVQPKDVITRINGKNVTSVAELRELVGRSKVGETLNLTLVREGKTLDLPVRMKTRNNN